MANGINGKAKVYMFECKMREDDPMTVIYFLDKGKTTELFKKYCKPVVRTLGVPFSELDPTEKRMLVRGKGVARFKD